MNLVTGYLPDIDTLNKKARQNGLTKRMAVILDTYHPGHNEAYYDHEQTLCNNITSAAANAGTAVQHVYKGNAKEHLSIAAKIRRLF